MRGSSAGSCDSGGKPRAVPERPEPYVGPRPFERADAPRFFGRNREARELVARVVAHSVVLLYATSGAGKTSLVNAGVTPLLEKEQGFKVLPVARVRELSAGPPDPTANAFVSAIAAHFDLQLHSGARLVDVLRRAVDLGEDDQFQAPRALILDQLEEVFTAHPERWRDRRDLFEQIAEAVETDPLLRVILVMREDHVAKLEPYRQLLPEQLRARLRLELMGSRAAELAASAPLEGTGRRFASGVVEQLVDDLRTFFVESDEPGKRVEVVGEYVEPVHLQVACAALWRDLPSEVKEITSDHLRRFADVDEVLARFYDEAIAAAAARAGMDEGELRVEFERLFITPMGTRGTAYLRHGAARRIPGTAIAELEQRHLIRAEWRAGTRWFELTHDRMIEPVRAANERKLLHAITDAEPRGREAPVVEERRGALASLLSKRGARDADYEQYTSAAAEPDAGDGGTALCLSGGGNRAILFNAGALARLNEAGYLATVDRIAGVSGGAIAAATLGAAWSTLDFDERGVANNLDAEVIARLRDFARVTIDWKAMVSRVFGVNGNKRLVRKLRDVLFGDATLLDLPGRPEIVVVAANLESGQPFRFSRQATGDTLTGWRRETSIEIAKAVAASAALAPAFSPAHVTLETRDGDGEGQEVELTDGSVFDSLALESVWRRFDTIMVSDPRSRHTLGKSRGWWSHFVNILAAEDNELHALRRRQLITAYVTGVKVGAYWSIGADIASYGLADTLPAPRERTAALARYPSRLAAVPDHVQERLINWGYAAADAAYRAHVDPEAEPPTRFLYPEAGIG